MNKLKWNAGQIVNDTNEYELAQFPATDKPKYLVDYDFKDMEIARLNKIIDDLEKWLEEQHQFIIEIPAYTKEISIEHKTMELCYENILDKLKELKEEGK